MTCRDIIREYLEQNDYDGLAGDGCGCGLDELFLCTESGLDCLPAIKSACGGCEALIKRDKDCPYGFEMDPNQEFCYVAGRRK